MTDNFSLCSCYNILFFKLEMTQMMVNQKILFTTINNESGLTFSTDAGCTDLHGLGDLGFLCSLGSGLEKEKHIKYNTVLHIIEF